MKQPVFLLLALTATFTLAGAWAQTAPAATVTAPPVTPGAVAPGTPEETPVTPPSASAEFTVAPRVAGGTVRAAWIRPTADLSAAEAAMDGLAARGYTDVFVEAFYHGQAIWPSKVAPQDPAFAERDGLREYADIGEAYGLRVHAWMEALYWQPPTKYGLHSVLLQEHPDWETLDVNGRRSSEVAEGMGFADPGVYAVRHLLYDLAAEVAVDDPNVGLHLDYLRYPAGADFGYNPKTVQGFQDVKGRRPVRYLDAPWFGFRRDLVTDLANGMARSYRAAGGLSSVSAAVNAQYPLWHLETLQDWSRWTGGGRDKFDRGVDAFVPMAYSVSTLYLRGLTRYVLGRSPRPVWLGLRIGAGFPRLEELVAAAEAEGAQNYAVFDALP